MGVHSNLDFGIYVRDCNYLSKRSQGGISFVRLFMIVSVVIYAPVAVGFFIYRTVDGPRTPENDPEETENLIDDPEKQEIIVTLKGNLEDWFCQYVNPRLDGTHEPVSGKGQRTPASPAGSGVKASFRKDE